jgi:hypothetical protein
MTKKSTPQPAHLTQHERTVIRAASTGDVADFTALKTPPVLRASIIRRLVVGLAQTEHRSADPVTPRGVRIKRASIQGELDLSGWSGRADDPSRPLPTLEFETCTLDAPLYLDESHIHSIKLFACTLTLLSADSARIDGSVHLNGSMIWRGQ